MKENEHKHRRLLRDGEAYKRVIVYYQNHPEEIKPEIELPLQRIFKEARMLGGLLKRFEKGMAFQETLAREVK